MNCDLLNTGLGKALSELGQLGRQLVPSAPGDGVVGEDLDRVRANGLRPIGGLEQSMAELQMGADQPLELSHDLGCYAARSI